MVIGVIEPQTEDKVTSAVEGSVERLVGGADTLRPFLAIGYDNVIFEISGVRVAAVVDAVAEVAELLIRADAVTDGLGLYRGLDRKSVV